MGGISARLAKAGITKAVAAAISAYFHFFIIYHPFRNSHPVLKMWVL